MFISRSGRGTRFTAIRVGLFFLAAGLWLAGVRIGDRRMTAVAIGVAVLALLLGILGRWTQSRADRQGRPKSDEETERRYPGSDRRAS